MELIHQDPPLEREYLKRLLKRRKQPNITKSSSDMHPDSRMAKGSIRENVEPGSELSLLKIKLITREEEILRLQAII
jgi:hypothetical protein